jgi:hypothetical protein
MHADRAIQEIRTTGINQTPDAVTTVKFSYMSFPQSVLSRHISLWLRRTSVHTPPTRTVAEVHAESG